MLCRNRWAGLEQEGFGIVFLEAAAAGVPQVAGDSGGAAEAVLHGETGLVVDHPDDVDAVAAALDELLADPDRRARMAVAGRERAVAEFTYDGLAARLGDALAEWEAGRVADEARNRRLAPSTPATGPSPAPGWSTLAFVGTGAIVVTSVAAAAAPDTFGSVHAVLSVVLFVVGTGAMLWAYALGVSRSRTELVSIPGLFFLADDVRPAAVRRALRGRDGGRGRRGGRGRLDPSLHRGGLRDPRPHVRAGADGPVGRPPRHVPAPLRRARRLIAAGAVDLALVAGVRAHGPVGPECADG